MPVRTGATQSSLVVGGLGLAVLWFILIQTLSLEWSGNEQYSYGWFVPFFAAYLFWLRWEDRPAATPCGARGRAGLALLFAAIVTLFFLLPIRLFEIAAPDWRPLGWMHAGVVVALTLLVVWLAGGKKWARHFAFPVCFILIAVPWIAGIEVLVVQGLMRCVAVIAAEALSLSGIPAQLEGNLLRLRTGVVGVNEACSGVRSLQTSLMIGLLFGELQRLNLARRLGLVAAAAAIAFVGNVCRAFFLVWVAAHEGIDATERWHDTTGYSIVGLVFFGTMGVASLLARRKGRAASSPEAAAHKPEGRALAFKLRTSAAGATLLWLIAIELGVEGWYRWQERHFVARQPWSVQWPEAAKNFRDIPLDERMRGILRFDEGRGATWQLPDPAQPVQASASVSGVNTGRNAPLTSVLYFFRWEEGRSSILRARGHRPDICMPSIGWQQTGDHGSQQYAAGGISLPFRHFEFVRNSPGPQPAQMAHAFFSVGEDMVKPTERESETERELSGMQGFTLIPKLWSLVRAGERPRGQQVMQVILVSRTPLSPAEAQSRLAEMVRALVTTPPSPPHPAAS